MDVIMKRQAYKIKYDAVLKNRFNNETVYGNIINEREIDGKPYWVLNIPSRGAAQLSYAKESWLLMRGK
jgi:hypothetical protein